MLIYFIGLVQMNRTTGVNAKDLSDLWNSITLIVLLLFYRKVERKARHDEIRRKYGMYEPRLTLYYRMFSIQPV